MTVLYPVNQNHRTVLRKALGLAVLADCSDVRVRGLRVARKGAAFQNFNIEDMSPTDIIKASDMDVSGESATFDEQTRRRKDVLEYITKNTLMTLQDFDVDHGTQKIISDEFAIKADQLARARRVQEFANNQNVPVAFHSMSAEGVMLAVLNKVLLKLRLRGKNGEASDSTALVLDKLTLVPRLDKVDSRRAGNFGNDQLLQRLTSIKGNCDMNKYTGDEETRMTKASANESSNLISASLSLQDAGQAESTLSMFAGQESGLLQHENAKELRTWANIRDHTTSSPYFVKLAEGACVRHKVMGRFFPGDKKKKLKQILMGFFSTVFKKSAEAISSPDTSLVAILLGGSPSEEHLKSTTYFSGPFGKVGAGAEEKVKELSTQAAGESNDKNFRDTLISLSTPFSEEYVKKVYGNRKEHDAKTQDNLTKYAQLRLLPVTQEEVQVVAREKAGKKGNGCLGISKQKQDWDKLKNYRGNRFVRIPGSPNDKLIDQLEECLEWFVGLKTTSNDGRNLEKICLERTWTH